MAADDAWKAEFDSIFKSSTEGLAKQFETPDPSLIPIQNIRDVELKAVEGKLKAYTTNHKNQAFVNIMEHITDVLTKLDKVDVEYSQNRKILRRQVMQELADARSKLEAKLHPSNPNCTECQQVTYRK